MPSLTLKTPLIAAFFCAVFLSGCATKTGSPASKCPSTTHPVSSVQGSGYESPLLDEQVVVKGVVTLIQSGQGLYIEEPGSDSDERTSNAIFVQASELPGEIAPGALIGVRGRVTESGEGRHPVTTLAEVSEIIPCGSVQALPLTKVSLPLSNSDRESLEGMRVGIDGPLVATDVYRFGRGDFTLSGNGFQYIPTEVMQPGPAAASMAASNRANALPVHMPDSLTGPKLLISGTDVGKITGVMAHDGRGLRLSLQSISTGPTPILPTPGKLGGDSVRVVGMNLHNYFNGDGKGSGFPTQRGAETAEEFESQRARIGGAIGVLNPHVIAVMELENDGFGANSAAQDFIRLASEATGNDWAVSRPANDNTGDDKIAVGIFYRGDRLEAIGPAQTLTGPEFERSRQPQAQLFRQLPDGESILIVINHLKSKGSCPDAGENADQGDGQGCWNPMRTASAEIMSAWTREVAETSGTDNVLVLGDMNAYRNEDPIKAIRAAGFMELVEEKSSKDTQARHHSFVYYGQHGSLDYAFSSPALLDNVQQAIIWNVNAVFPADTRLPQPWLRFSDHDPVVVDLSLRHSMTSD